MKDHGRFLIRVYALILSENEEILLSDEFQLGMRMTKFPGGGLNYGEGTLDCLRREIREECNGQELKNIRHFYTTDFFQQALFFDNHQLISVYYLAEFSLPFCFTISDNPFNFQQKENGNQSFRFVKLKDLKPEDLSFPIDKFVLQELKKLFV